MKRMILILLLCALLLSTTASAWSMEDTLSERFTYSPWAEEALTKADDLNLITQGEGDLRYAITRAQFAQDASRLVALAYDRTPASIYAITKLRAGKAGADDIWLWLSQQLGILQGRENGDLDGEAYITRQEAAVILARTYRLYAGEGPELTQPLPYSDADEIASWAVEDVRRMTQLGILGGVENGRFAPQAYYSIEQCYATLVRLYEKTLPEQPQGEDPFAATPREEAEAALLDFVEINLEGYCAGEDASVVVISRGGLPPNAGRPYYMVYLDKDLQETSFRPVVLTADGDYYSQEAPPENVTLSPDGQTIQYTATVPEDVYYITGMGERGELVFAKGLYTVTLDVATGEQTYTRTDLP